MFELLQEDSILLIGERIGSSNIIWVQLYSTSNKLEEEEQRKILFEIKTQILKQRVKSGSFRKFMNARLLYYEVDRTPTEKTRNKIICLYTKQKEQGTLLKKAIEMIAYRGGAFGVYSASRFFSEMVDLLLTPEKLNTEEIELEQALKLIDEIDGQNIKINEVGHLISLINRSQEMDHDTIEKLYFIVYERISSLDQIENDKDPDEFLDASYLIARRYLESDNFYLALELFKKIIPFAIENRRLDLETVCRIRIATIYKDYFPEPGQYILDILEPISIKKHIGETSKPNVEIFFCLLGFAYQSLKNKKQAIKHLSKAVELAKDSVGSPSWISSAYSGLAKYSQEEQLFSDASRQYLTAVTIAFSSGYLAEADEYRDLAGINELETSYSLIHASNVHRMEGFTDLAEYRAWDSLRSLIKALQHMKIQHLSKFTKKIQIIIDTGANILDIKGKRRQNKTIIRKISSTITEIHDFAEEPSFTVKDVELNNLLIKIDERIPIPPPTFMLLSSDGRLILLGEVHNDGWQESSLEGTILSGVLAAIMALITEVSESNSSLRTIDAGEFQIMLEQRENVVSVLLVDRDLPEFRKQLRSIINHIDDDYGEYLKYWNGHGEPSMISHIQGFVVDTISPDW